VQPDNGKVCTFWIAALISAIDPKYSSSMEFRADALQHLITVVYIYTGQIVPEQLRQSLIGVLASIKRICACQMAPSLTGRKKTTCHLRDVAHARTVYSASALAYLLQSEETFSAHYLQLHDLLGQLNNSGHNAMLQHSIGKAVAHLAPDYLCQLDNRIQNDGHYAPSTYNMSVRTIVRGCGLVASAFGMLHCQAAVDDLVAKWAKGAWFGRIDSVHDVIISYAHGSGTTQCQTARSSGGEEAQAQSRRAPLWARPSTRPGDDSGHERSV
jgi:hypothetical protein